MQANRGQDKPVGDVYPEPNVSNPREEDEGAGKEGMSAHEAHARKKHNAVPSQLLNADPLAQIIGTETVADVIINDAEVCALLDSRAMADLMSSAYVEARGFDVRPITELSDRYVKSLQSSKIIQLSPTGEWRICSN